MASLFKCGKIWWVNYFVHCEHVRRSLDKHVCRPRRSPSQTKSSASAYSAIILFRIGPAARPCPCPASP